MICLCAQRLLAVEARGEDSAQAIHEVFFTFLARRFLADAVPSPGLPDLPTAQSLIWLSGTHLASHASAGVMYRIGQVKRAAITATGRLINV